jgi:hypothetical protein
MMMMMMKRRRRRRRRRRRMTMRMAMTMMTTTLGEGRHHRPKRLVSLTPERLLQQRRDLLLCILVRPALPDHLRHDWIQVAVVIPLQSHFL